MSLNHDIEILQHKINKNPSHSLIFLFETTREYKKIQELLIVSDIGRLYFIIMEPNTLRFYSTYQTPVSCSVGVLKLLNLPKKFRSV